MKRFIIFLVILGVMIGGVVAATLDSATLTLTTSVQGVYQVGVFDAKVTTNGAFAADTNLTEELGTITLGGTDTVSSRNLFLAVRSNQKFASTINFVLNDLSTNEADKLKYNFIELNEVLSVRATHTSGGSDTHTFKVPSSQGLTVYNFPFRIEITHVQYEAAIEGFYSAAIVFEATAQ